jgi:hypothetical protein
MQIIRFTLNKQLHALKEIGDLRKPEFIRHARVYKPGARSPEHIHFFKVAPKTCGFSVGKLLHFAQLAPRVVRLFLHGLKICAPLA